MLLKKALKNVLFWIFKKNLLCSKLDRLVFFFGQKSTFSKFSLYPFTLLIIPIDRYKKTKTPIKEQENAFHFEKAEFYSVFRISCFIVLFSQIVLVLKPSVHRDCHRDC